MSDLSVYRNEEKFNTISHGFGAILGIIGFFFLLSKNSEKTSYTTISIVVYSFTVVLMFVTSAIYHALSNPIWKNRFRILDHICIYLLIAGTYTPLALITLESSKGWPIFYTVWIISGLGTIMKLFYTGKYEFISLLLYLAMGWLLMFDFDKVVDYTSSLGFLLLFLGGAFYTLGIIFYAIERIPYNHFIWHLFVLAGAICHWIFIFIDVV